MRQYRDRASGHFGVEYIISFDDDDPVQSEVVALLEAAVQSREMSEAKHFELHWLSGPPLGSNAAWNRAWERSRGRCLLQSSDDFEPAHGWDEQLVHECGGSGFELPKVIGVSDIHGCWDAPLTGDGAAEFYIATAAYCRRSGYFVYPEYANYGVFDVDQKAIVEDALVNAYQVRFLHNWHGGENDPLRDDTYRRLNLVHKPLPTRQEIDRDRIACGYLDIRLDGDPNRPLDPSREHLAAPCVPMSEVEQIWRRRREAGFAHLRNILPANPEDARHDYHAGRYAEAYNKLCRLRDYYSVYCNGRMRHFGIDAMIAVCKGQMR